MKNIFPIQKVLILSVGTILILFQTISAQNYNDVKRSYRNAYKKSYVTFKAGGAYNAWFPSQPKRADISTTGYAGYYLNFTAKYKNYFRLYQLKYEAKNGIEPPKTKSRDQLIRENTSGTAYLIYNILSDFLSFEKFHNMSIILRSRGENFKSDVKFKNDVTYQPYHIRKTGRIYNYNSDDIACFYTRFTDNFFGLAFGKYNERFYIGLGNISYQKPYSFQIGQMSMDDALHDAKFTATTLGGGLELNPKSYNGEGLSISAFLHMGPGDIELVYKEISISQIAQKFNSNVQYLGFDTELKYIKPLYKKNIYIGGVISATGKTFKLQEPEDETYEEMSFMNNDFILGFKGFITFLF